MGDGSPLSFSGKKPLEKDLMVPQFVAHLFGKFGRASLASCCSPYPYMQQITNQPADVTWEPAAALPVGTENTEKGVGQRFSDALRSDAPSWAPPVSQLAGN